MRGLCILQSVGAADVGKKIQCFVLAIPKACDWEEESIHRPPCSSEEVFLAEESGGKNLVVDMVFLDFIGFLYLPPAWKVFL